MKNSLLPEHMPPILPIFETKERDRLVENAPASHQAGTRLRITAASCAQIIVNSIATLRNTFHHIMSPKKRLCWTVSAAVARTSRSREVQLDGECGPVTLVPILAASHCRCKTEKVNCGTSRRPLQRCLVAQSLEKNGRKDSDDGSFNQVVTTMTNTISGTPCFRT